MKEIRVSEVSSTFYTANIKRQDVQPSFKATFQTAKSNNISYKRYLIEKIIERSVQKLKTAKFSQNAIVRNIEEELLTMGVNVRFKNDLQLAEYIQSGVKSLISNDIEPAKNILFTKPFLPFAAAVWAQTFPQKEAPIILPNNIYKKEHTIGKYSTNHPLHTFFHETGHWRHFCNNFNPDENYKLWLNYADTEKIKELVSERAASLPDGSELCAEVFAGIMAGKESPPYITNLVKLLGFPS